MSSVFTVSDQIDEGHSYIEIGRTRIYFDLDMEHRTELGMSMVDMNDNSLSVGDSLSGTQVSDLIGLLAENLRRMKFSDLD